MDLNAIRAQVEIVDMSLGAWRSQVLYSGVRLGLFECLGKGPKTLEEICDELNCPARSMERLLTASRAMKLVQYESEKYSNGLGVQTTLVGGQSAYLANWLRLMSFWYSPWGKLEQAIRTGEHVEDPDLHLGGDPEYTDAFIRGMHDYASYRGSDLLEYLDLTGTKRLLDVGGGSGAYSIMFAERYPELESTIFDLPDPLEIARGYVNAAGVETQVHLQAGDYNEDEFGSDYDVVFLSNMLHQEDPQVGKMILEKSFRALRSGGRVVVQAMFLNDDNSGPEWPALHNIMTMLVYRGGTTYSIAQTLPLLEDAGFVDMQRVEMSVFNVNSLLIGVKPRLMRRELG